MNELINKIKSLKLEVIFDKDRINIKPFRDSLRSIYKVESYNQAIDDIINLINDFQRTHNLPKAT